MKNKVLIVILGSLCICLNIVLFKIIPESKQQSSTEVISSEDIRTTESITTELQTTEELTTEELTTIETTTTEIQTTEELTTEEIITTEAITEEIKKDTLEIDDSDKDNFIVTLNGVSYTYPKEYEDAKIEFPEWGKQYGTIIVPSVDINTSIIRGDTQELVDANDTVISGQASYCGSGLPVILCGHKTRSFAKLYDLKKGNYIIVSTNYGGFVYKVKKTIIGTINDSNTNIIDKDGNELLKYDGKIVDNQKLQIYTCYGVDRGVERFVVIAEEVVGTKLLH